MQSLMKNALIGEVGAPIAAANNTDSNSDILDMQGYDGVTFITSITDSTDTGTCTLTVEQNTANSDTGMAALSGATCTGTSAADDDLNNTLLIVEVYRPLERYVQCVRTTATANGAFGSLIAIRWRGRKFAVTADSTVTASAVVTSPSEA